MAKFSFKVSSFTPVAVADTVAFTDGGYMALQGGSATARIDISEISISGIAAASAPSILLLSRDSTVGATPTALSAGNSNAPLDPGSAALTTPPVAFVASTTKPQRSATAGLLNLSLNAFGGIYRWVANQGSEIRMLGNAAAFGEISLSHFTGGVPGLIGAHIIYEPM